MLSHQYSQRLIYTVQSRKKETLFDFDLFLSKFLNCGQKHVEESKKQISKQNESIIIKLVSSLSSF